MNFTPEKSFENYQFRYEMFFDRKTQNNQQLFFVYAKALPC